MKHKYKKIRRQESERIDSIISLWNDIINEYKHKQHSYYQDQTVEFTNLVCEFREHLYLVSNFSALFFAIKQKYKNHQYYSLCWKNIFNCEELVVYIVNKINQPCLEAIVISYYLSFGYNVYNSKIKSLYLYERLNVYMNDSRESLSLISNDCYSSFEHIQYILDISSNKLSVMKEILGNKFNFIRDIEFFDKLIILCYKYLDLSSVNYGIWFYNSVNRLEDYESEDLDEFKNLNEIFLRFFPNNYTRDWWRTERYNIEKEKTVKYIHQQFKNMYNRKLYETIFFVKQTTYMFNIPNCLIKGISEFLIEPFTIHNFDYDSD